ncbi:hypothetical protein FKP32DRAFT_1177249 [Trametes sanguinea]|nr:hypothetical protein FKP32DRAFT_1177249 [Trametes sanguinea]
MTARQAGQEGAFPCGRTLQKPTVGSFPPAPRNEGPAVALIIHTPLPPVPATYSSNRPHGPISYTRYSRRDGREWGWVGAMHAPADRLLVIEHVQNAARIALLRSWPLRRVWFYRAEVS